MIDNFSLPEICTFLTNCPHNFQRNSYLPFLGLISDTIEYFHEKGIMFDPGYVYADVTKAVSHIHLSGELHNAIMNDLPRYLQGKRPLMAKFLSALKKQGKKVCFFFRRKSLARY